MPQADPASKRSRKKRELEQKRQQSNLERPEQRGDMAGEPGADDEKILAQLQPVRSCYHMPISDASMKHA
eukprot:9427486-Pyramimonas_sp.AAC.1